MQSSISAALKSWESRLQSFQSNPMRFAWKGAQLHHLDKSATTVRLSLRLVRQEPEHSISDRRKALLSILSIFNTSAPIHLGTHQNWHCIRTAFRLRNAFCLLVSAREILKSHRRRQKVRIGTSDLLRQSWHFLWSASYCALRRLQPLSETQRFAFRHS